MHEEQLLDTEEAAKFLSLSKSFLEKLRLTGEGPSYLKIGRAVRYRMNDLRDWLVSRARQSTSEDSSAA